MPGPGVLVNDTDPDGDALTAVLVTGPSHGTVDLHSDGLLVYTPDPNYSGTDTFSYKANDGQANSNVATVTITVNPVNDPPSSLVMSVDRSTIDEGQWIYNFAGGFTDPDAGECHRVVINWGDSTPNTEFNIIARELSFDDQLHLYADNRANDTPFTVMVTVSEIPPAGNESVTETVDVTVKNVWPQLVQSVGVEFVTIGDPGNIADVNGRGSVSYAYAIGKYEVTIGQYLDFLIAVAKKDPYGLWDSRMGSGAYGTVPGYITRSGPYGNYTYSLANGNENFRNRPVTWVNFWDTVRFTNWLHNGRPTTGEEDDTTTEDGAYALNGRTGGDASGVVRKPGANFSPRRGRMVQGGLLQGRRDQRGLLGLSHPERHPTRRMLPPGVAEPPGAANFSDEQQHVLDPSYFTTPVGAYTYSPGPYGTFDQGGNVHEWVDYDGACQRGAAGGTFGYPVSWLNANSVSGQPGTPADWYWTTDMGFRIAAQAAGVTVVPTVIEENGTVTARGTVSDPGTLDTHTVTIDWGDGQTSRDVPVDPI